MNIFSNFPHKVYINRFYQELRYFMLFGVSKYGYFSISHRNCCYTCQYMKFFKFDFLEDFDLAKLIFTQKSNSKHHESTFRRLCVSRYSYFSISHINCYYTCQYMKFFKFNYFWRFCPCKTDSYSKFEFKTPLIHFLAILSVII